MHSVSSAPAVFALPAARLADAQTRVDRYARKAVKVNLPAPALRVVAEYERTTFIGKGGRAIGTVEGFAPINPLAPHTSEPFVLVEVTGERPIIRGFEFAATIEHANEGNFVWAVPCFSDEIPAEYRDASARVCDHCKTARNRNKTYVLRNVETGDFMRVGSSCLQDHLGHADPAVWLDCYQWLREAQEEGECYGEDAGSFGGALAVPVLTFLAGVIVYCRGFGFTSKAAADDRNPATAVVVRMLLSDRKEAVNFLEAIDAAAVAKAAEVLAWLKVQDDSSGFIYNAQLAAKMHTVELRTAGVLAAIVPSFDRELVAKQREAARTNEHLAAKEGERVVLDLTVERISSWYNETFGNWTSIVIMSDAEGRTFTWRTSGGVCNVDGVEVEDGQSFRVLATVKGFDAYKGTKQTQLTRCKLFAEGESDAPSLRTATRKLCKARGVAAPAWAATDAAKKRAAKAS